MKENEKNEELLSRREFFKSAAKGVLPILGLTILEPTLLSSCKKDECSGDCVVSCSDSCVTGCKTSCDASCTSGCTNTCQTTCSRLNMGQL